MMLVHCYEICFQPIVNPRMKVDDYDANNFNNPDILRRINALLDHSLDMSAPSYHDLHGRMTGVTFGGCVAFQQIGLFLFYIWQSCLGSRAPLIGEHLG